MMIEANGSLQLLLSRLVWPSGMVRERTVDAIAELLVHPSLGDETGRALLAWMLEQKLESMVVFGLLALIRARSKDAKWEAPDQATVARTILKPSIVSMLLERELYGRSSSQVDWRQLCSGEFPDGFVPDPFFTKFASRFLPPIFVFWSGRIDQLYHVRFSHQWALEWDNLVASLGIDKSAKPLDFLGMQHYDHYAVFDTVMSEVYRSAFLRALAWMVSISALPPSEAELYANGTCELDLGLWVIDPIARPGVWPKAEKPKGSIDTIPAQIWSQVSSAWEQEKACKDPMRLVQASGRVYHDSKTIYDLDVFGAFQRCEGGNAPAIQDIVDWYAGRPDASYEPDGLAFGGRVSGEDAATFQRDFGDWAITSAARTVMPLLYPRWEHWKVAHHIWFPHPYVDLQFSCSPEGVITRDNNGKCIAKWQVWADGLRDKDPGMATPASGEQLLVSTHLIEELAAEHASVFCWLCRLVGYHRQYDGHEWQSFSDYRSFGTSNIVLPD